MNKKGFTLVELIVSFALLIILVGSVFYVFGVGWRLWKRSLRKFEHCQIASLVLERIRKDVRSASEILPSSNPNELLIKVGSDIIGYQLTGGKVCRKKNGFPSYLTNENEVTKLIFAYPSLGLVEIRVDDFITCTGLRN